MPRVIEGHRPGRIGEVMREIVDAIEAPGQRVYVNGVAFVGGSDGRFGKAEAPSADAPRHPSDPAWFVDVLYDAVAPVRQQRVLIHRRKDRGNYGWILALWCYVRSFGWVALSGGVVIVSRAARSFEQAIGRWRR